MSTRELTPAQKQFVIEVTRTDPDRAPTITDAYERCYHNNSSRMTNTNDASRLLRKPHVKAAIDAENAKIEMDRRRSRRTSATRIETALWHIVQNSESDAVQVSALRELKTMLPKDAIEDSEENESALNKHELIDRLNTILSSRDATAIDVTPGAEPDEDQEREDAILEIEAELMTSFED